MEKDKRMKTTLTARERAERMVQDVLLGIDGGYFDYFLAEILEAEREAYKAGAEAGKKLHKSCLALIESDIDEDIDMDTFVTAIEEYEKVMFPIGPLPSGSIDTTASNGEQKE